MGNASGNGKCYKGLKMTKVQSKHVALLKSKKDCADVYCVTLIELQAHHEAFIQNIRINSVTLRYAADWINAKHPLTEIRIFN